MSCKYCKLKLDREELEFGYKIYRGEEVEEGYIYAYGEDNDKFGYSQHTCGVDAGISDIKYCPFCGDRLEVKEAK